MTRFIEMLLEKANRGRPLYYTATCWRSAVFNRDGDSEPQFKTIVREIEMQNSTEWSKKP